MKEEEKDQPAGFFMDSLKLFFFFLLTSRSYGYSGHQWIYSMLSKMMTYTRLCCCCVCVLLGCMLPLAQFFFGLTSPPHQWHTINYYTCFFVHLPSLISAGNIFCLSFSKVAPLLLLLSHLLAGICCLPYCMLMALTNVLQRMGEESSLFCRHVTLPFFQNRC